MSLGIASEKIYIDIDDLSYADETFHIHEGENIWIQSNVIHSEPRGFYIYESDIVKSHEGAYEKKWRCPYCNSHWPIGTPCQNPNCPSKYK